MHKPGAPWRRASKADLCLLKTLETILPIDTLPVGNGFTIRASHFTPRRVPVVTERQAQRVSRMESEAESHESRVCQLTLEC